MIKKYGLIVGVVVVLISIFLYFLQQDIRQENIGQVVVQTIEEMLVGKTAIERANIKGVEIVKYDFRGEYTDQTYGIRIDIQSIKKIDGGIEVFARGWKGTNQLGFGIDGSVEIERFLIYNPPIMVDDPTGTTIINYTDTKGNLHIRKLKENPTQAIKEVIAHNIFLIGKENTNIIKGKVGNTTSTFFPDAHTESTSVDGYAFRSDSSVTFSGIRSAAGNGSQDSSALSTGALLRASVTTDRYDFLFRTIFVFDTSALPDGDDITSATFSLQADGHTSDFGGGFSLVRSPTSITTSIANSDYDIGNWDMTKQADTDVVASTWDNVNYNDWTLNATGEGNISKTSLTFLGVVVSFDQANSAPSWGSGDDTQLDPVLFAETSGTASDPKLVIEHGAEATVPSIESDFIIFE